MKNKRLLFLALVAFVVSIGRLPVFTQQPPATAAPDGETLFLRGCVINCHDGSDNARAAGREVLRQRAPEAILDALSNGGMRVEGAKLSGPERRAIAEFLTGRALGFASTGAATGRCTVNPPFSLTSGPTWNGWSPTPTNARFQPATAAGLTADQVPHLVLKWAFGFPDATSSWAQPTVVGGRVFVGSHNGTVYSLDAKSGCIHWFYSAEGAVRTAMSVGPRTGGAFNVYFGDTGANAEVWHRTRLQWRPTGGGQRDPGCRVLGVERRRHARLFDQGRIDHLGG